MARSGSVSALVPLEHCRIDSALFICIVSKAAVLVTGSLSPKMCAHKIQTEIILILHMDMKPVIDMTVYTWACIHSFGHVYISDFLFWFIGFEGRANEWTYAVLLKMFQIASHPRPAQSQSECSQMLTRWLLLLVGLVIVLLLLLSFSLSLSPGVTLKLKRFATNPFLRNIYTNTHSHYMHV